MASDSPKLTQISDLKLRPIHYYILLVCSMEQIIGAALSAVVGIMIPMIALLHGQALSSWLQGLIGASGLIGIAVGSAVLGKIADNKGYPGIFRLCPAIMLIFSVLIWLIPKTYVLVPSLFMIGFGVGGGYSLDSSYISELMPTKWKHFMVGVAKATSAIGFMVIPGICWLILRDYPEPRLWNAMILLIGALALITLLMRVNWPGSPVWLLGHGRRDAALKAARKLFGSDVTVAPVKQPASQPSATWGSLFKGDNLKKVIYSGIPWACEGVGVYGVGVFLPILVMALGLSPEHLVGMEKVTHSIAMTTVINFFIIPGFIIGLAMVGKMNHVKMLAGGFWIYSAGVVLVLVAYLLKWPVWVSILGFLVFEVALNAGPHLITYIIPTEIYPVAERGAGAGIAAMLGKVGAIIGVFLMPVLLEIGGITVVLIFCAAVGIVGALIANIFGYEVEKQLSKPLN